MIIIKHCRQTHRWKDMFVCVVSLHPSQHFSQLCLDRSSWVEPVLSLAQGHNVVPPMSLKPEIPRSPVKHSTTEPLCSSEMERKINRPQNSNHYHKNVFGGYKQLIKLAYCSD